MNTYARIQNGIVAELISVSVDPATLFRPELVWEPVNNSAVEVGWLYATGQFSAAPPPSLPVLPPPSLAQLQAELATITQQIAALSAAPATPSSGA